MKKIFSSIIAAVVAVPLLLTSAPAQADTATARSNWRNFALAELSSMESIRTQGLQDDYKAWTNAYQAELTAFKYGTWNNQETLDLLDNVYAEKKATAQGGYGMNREHDAFGDGDCSQGISCNSEATTYTVTTADHVGEVLLNGYQAGVVPASEVYYVVDALMAQPTVLTGHGECMLYSSKPANDGDWCVVNVSAGAAAFLKKAHDAGIQRTGQLALVNDLKPFVTWSYEQAIEELSADAQGVNSAIIKQGFWPYAYEKSTGSWQFSRDGRAQDWNHNAYTSESAITLGLSSGLDSAEDMLDMPNYRHPKILRTPPYERKVTDAREVEGRMRIQGLLPNHKPKNMWQDARFYVDNYTNRALTDHAQAGRWAARMADNAHADSIVAKTADFLITPKVYIGDTLYPGNPATVPSGSKIVLRGDVRVTDSSLGTDRQYTFIVNKDVIFRVNGAKYDGPKNTGIDGNIAFVYTIHSNTCFVFRVKEPTGNVDSNQRCVNVS